MKRTSPENVVGASKRPRLNVFASGLSVDEKSLILQHVLRRSMTSDELCLLACDHMVRLGGRHDLRVALGCHSCSLQCAVRAAHADSFAAATQPVSEPVTSSTSSIDPSNAANCYDTELSLSQKRNTFSFLMSTQLSTVSYRDLLVVALDHGIHRTIRPTLWQTMQEHLCSWSCLVRTNDAVRAGQRCMPVDTMLFEQSRPTTFAELAQRDREEQYLREHRSADVDDGRDRSCLCNDSSIYSTDLTPLEKNITLRHILSTTLKSPSYTDLLGVAVDHDIQERGLELLGAAIRQHVCTSRCLVRTEHAVAAGQRDADIAPPCNSACNPVADTDESLDEDREDREELLRCRQNWPQVESWDFLKNILAESRAATTADALRRIPCSFCDMNELEQRIHYWDTDALDITLLDDAVATLRTLYTVPEIVSHRLFNGKYQACASCASCVRQHTFVRVPLYSWANGCWIGDVPEELTGLTFAEELVISRAHATKTWIKLNADHSCHQQRASHGNVCIHPHEIIELAGELPLPATALYEQIVVIIVTNNQAATAEMFNRTPLLVRPDKLLRALNWLKIHNRLYRDIKLDFIALASYNPDGTLPFPVQFVADSATMRGQNATYTGHGVDTAEDLFSTHHDDTEEQIPLSTTATFDVDLSETIMDLRKIEELRHLKEDRPFLKTSRSSETINTRNNPDAYGLLWPTLFPYGVGMFEDPARLNPGFRHICLKSHVGHLLKLADTRFQTHLSFIFIMQNLMMLRRSSHRSRLAVRRGWWPKAMTAMDLVTDDVLKHMTDVLVGKKARKDYTPYRAENEAEQAALDLLRYLEYCSDHIEGSTAEVMNMRHEIRALCNESGTPSIFFTLNPADTFNPLCSFVTGHDINLDTLFDEPDSRYSAFQRASSLAANPIGGARFFKLMVDQLINTFLGFRRECKKGVFGRVKHYYGVVEAQNRGSLHLHILIWLEGALSPKQIQQRCSTDEEFRTRLFAWLDAIVKYELPAGGPPENSLCGHDKRCLLSRPPHPALPNFDDLWTTHLSRVLASVSQIHSHNDTCFKKIVRAFSLLTEAERDELCRFFYPQDIVPETYINEDGRIFFRRLHRFMVGHNPIISGGFQCNTDAKFIGSGSFGMALSVYMTSYTAKSSLDSAIVMSALAAALTALGKEMSNASEDQCRSLLLKTLNQMNGRRELSGQQIASSILAIPNHFTDCRFQKVYWSSTLSWLAPIIYEPRPSIVDDESHAQSVAVNAEDGLLDAEPLQLADAFVAFHRSRQEPPPSSIVYDVFYRPESLEDVCMWDFISCYEKVSLVTAKGDADATNCQDDIDLPADDEPLLDDGVKRKKTAQPILTFCCGHPQLASHGLRKRSQPHIPVLLGCPIPRRDLSEQNDRYAVAMLALFMPWRRSQSAPLYSQNTALQQAFQEMTNDLSLDHVAVINCMQEQWECRDAAADFSAMSRQRYASFAAGGGHHVLGNDIAEDEYSNDLNWQLGQLDDNRPTSVDVSNIELSSTADFDERCGLRALQSVNATRILTTAANIYTSNVTDNNFLSKIGGTVNRLPDLVDDAAADAAELQAGDRAAVLQLRHARTAGSSESSPETHRNRDYSKWYNAPMRTTLTKENALAKSQSERAHSGDPHYWNTLAEWQRLAISVSGTYTLNREQRIAFLLIATSRLDLLTNPQRAPYRLIVAGPGGTGKSRMYDAVKTFYTALGIQNELTFTAPTGIAAANIGGSTVAAELSLRVSLKSLLAANSRSLATLSERLQFTKTLIIDEFLFMGTSQFEKASRHINLARRCIDDPFGNLDLILSGDQFQLLCPNTTSLYNHRYTSLADVSAGVHSLNETTRRNAIAIKNYWDVPNCVVFNTVVRQKCPRYVALLTRLRKGVCTLKGEDSDLAYLQGFEIQRHRYSIVDDPINIGRWVEASLLLAENEHRSRAAPLITYTNYARNMHNWNMTNAFATSTGQDFAVYFARDFVGSGRKCIELTGRNADAAWRTPIKTNASDLSGRLPLVVGMPVLMVDNKAVELGLCNGAGGKLISISYAIRNNRRYATSAEVDFPGYTDPNADSPHPHRATVFPSRKSIEYMMERDSKVYSARRSQLPLIPGFSFTVHNSQSRTLNCLTAHLESCSTIAASYVLLSRICCGVEGPVGLHILGKVKEKNISGHVSEESRNEERRLQHLAADTFSRAEVDLRWFTHATGSEL